VIAVIWVSVGITLISCQDQESQSLSPWAVATWIIGDTLEDSELDLSARSGHIEARPAEMLSELSRLTAVEGRMGLLSLNQSSLGHWRGLYGYIHRAWPLGLQVDISQRQGQWTIHMLPDFDRYREMLELVGTDDSDPDLLLPWSEHGVPWAGGLIGRDLQGRPLSAVPLVRTSSGVIIDGVALEDEVTQSSLSVQLVEAFKQRRLLAQASQASYMSHVAIALSGETPALELIRLISWVEGAGADQISLIVQSERGPALIYLANRAEAIHLLTPQRLMIGTLTNSSIRLKVKETNQAQPEPIKEDVEFRRTSATMSATNQIDATATINTFFQRARQVHQLHGLSLTSTSKSTVTDLVSAIELIRVVDPELPITLTPVH
jgi:hypothetical protein